MANTADLIALQAEYPTAFADPETSPQVTAPPDMPEPDEECRTGETPQDGTLLGDEIASNMETMHPDQVRDFAEGYLQAQTGEELSDYERCNIALLQLEYQPLLLGIAARLLENLSEIASIHKRIGQEYFRLATQGVNFFDLPETHARQGTDECPSGMCPIDH
jgi:hypothetical protein